MNDRSYQSGDLTTLCGPMRARPDDTGASDVIFVILLLCRARLGPGNETSHWPWPGSEGAREEADSLQTFQCHFRLEDVFTS